MHGCGRGNQREDKFLRATNKRHYGSEKRYAKTQPDKATKTARTRKGVKVASIACAAVLVTAALVIPTTTLAPNVDAYEDSKAASFAVGNIDRFSSVIRDNCITLTTMPFTELSATTVQTTQAATDAKKEVKKTEAATEKATEKKEESTKATEAKKTEESKKETEKSEAKETKAKTTEKSESTKKSESVSKSDDEYYFDDYSDDFSAYEAPSYSTGYLVSIPNPDTSYSPSMVSLSSYDRAKLERLVMGEAGTMGYTGCALVAQSIRDAMNRSNTSSIDQIISQYQYFGDTDIEPNADVKNAVSFIFDQNGSAVQHRVLCFYIGYSSWHETQTFLTELGGVRFFDLNVA